MTKTYEGGGKKVGRFRVEFEIANNDDLVLERTGHLRRDQVRRQRIKGLVDCGATMLVLPQSVVKQLGLSVGEKINVRYADGRRAERREAKGAYLKLLGRDNVFSAIVEPRRETALIGAIVLEALDLLVDCGKERLIPRDPAGMTFEIE